MPEESTTGAPGLSAPEGGQPAEAPPAGNPATGTLPGPRPPRSHRKPLIIGAVAVVAAAAVAAAVLVIAKPGSQPLKYSTLPAPCGMLSAASVAKYLPGATSSVTKTPSGQASKVGACTWSSISGGEDRTLLLQVDVYGTSSGLASAEHAYSKEVPSANCQCQGYKVVRQSVTGLGDQATALFTSPTAAKTGTWNVPQVNLLVRSGNADINVGYIVAAIGKAPPPPSNAALLAAIMAMARNVLSALSR